MDNVTAELSVSVHQQSCQAAPSDFVEMTENLCSQLRPGKKQIYALYRNSSVILLLQNISTFFFFWYSLCSFMSMSCFIKHIVRTAKSDY